MKLIPDKINNSLAHRLDAITEFNPWKNDLQNLIIDSGQTLTGGTTDLHQFSKAVANISASSTFYSCTNVGDAYTLTPISTLPAPDSYVDGMEVRFRPSGSNTGASTVNVNALGVKNIKKEDGVTDIDAATIITTTDAYLRYDLAKGVFLFLLFSSGGGGGTGDTQTAVDTFVNGDLVTGVFTFNHAVGSQDAIGITVKDNTNKIIIPDDIEIIDNDNIDIDVSSYGTITGTWTVTAGFKI